MLLMGGITLPSAFERERFAGFVIQNPPKIFPFKINDGRSFRVYTKSLAV
jgi:hypothetical protein